MRSYDLKGFKRVPDILLDREIDSFRWRPSDQTPFDNIVSFKSDSINTSGDVISDGAIDTVFFDGGIESYLVDYGFKTPFLANGMHVLFRLRSWDFIQYIAVGYTYAGEFRHIKLHNCRIGHWVNIEFSHNDLIWKLQNNFSGSQDVEVENIKIYIKGTPSLEGGFLDVDEYACWLEKKDVPSWVSTWNPSQRIDNRLLNSLYDYFLKDDFVVEKGQQFLEGGLCPLNADSALNWPLFNEYPENFEDETGLRFAWHAIYPVRILLAVYKVNNNNAALFAARDFFSQWIEMNFFKTAQDKKYAWYDHGVAERLLTMIVLWDAGIENNFDYRFMVRLRHAMFLHAQLLSSEGFYTYHQGVRYHNHGCFQDVALIASAQFFGGSPFSEVWKAVAFERLWDQFDNLIIREKGFSILVENSIGYHQGAVSLIEFIASLIPAEEKEKQNDIKKISAEMSYFSDFFKYADNRTPLQGDTVQCPEESRDTESKEIICDKSLVVLEKAGYVVAKGRHQGAPYMLACLATSLNATHKHEDNLAFTLFFDGIEWLIDPSFYSHEYSQAIPSYLKSAAAHNNIFLPEIAYSTQAGKAKISGQMKSESEFTISGEHTCYDSYLVRREINGRLDRLDLTFKDSIVAQRKRNTLQVPKHAFLMFQCGEGVRASILETEIVLSHKSSRYQVHINIDAKNAKLYRGFENDNKIRGVSGTGYLESIDIDTIEIPVNLNSLIRWQIRVDK